MIKEWWRGAVIYQIYLRSFSDSNADGIGDLGGIIDRLDYIADLGVDAIWITPFFPSPMKDFGYDVSDYLGVDPVFGTLDDFRRLTDAAHDRGLRVMIDQVWSHTSTDHLWFKESRTSRTGPKADWFVWADPSPDGTPPNNWLSVFGGPAWTWEPRRRQYYLHHFLADQPQLNLRNDAVMKELLDSLRVWVERGVDGFRFDAIDFMLHDQGLRSNPARPPANGQIPSKLFGLQDHVHDMIHADSPALMERIRNYVDRFANLTTLGEVSSQDGALERIERYTGGNGTRLHMAYTLAIMKRDFGKAAFVEAIEDAERDLPDGWLCLAFSNHDVDRVVTRWMPPGGEAHAEQFVRLLMVLMLTLRGSACLYQGEELGLPQAEIAFADMQDPYGITFYPAFVGRDGARTPMPWIANGRGAGFTNGKTKPWLPIPDPHRDLAVEGQAADPNSSLRRWRDFLRWRRGQPALQIGAIRLVDAPDPVLAYERRTDDGHAVLVMANLGPVPVSLPAPRATPLAIRETTGRVIDEMLELPPFGTWLGTPVEG